MIRPFLSASFASLGVLPLVAQVRVAAPAPPEPAEPPTTWWVSVEPAPVAPTAPAPQGVIVRSGAASAVAPRTGAVVECTPPTSQGAIAGAEAHVAQEAVAAWSTAPGTVAISSGPAEVPQLSDLPILGQVFSVAGASADDETAQLRKRVAELEAKLEALMQDGSRPDAGHWVTLREQRETAPEAEGSRRIRTRVRRVEAPQPEHVVEILEDIPMLEGLFAKKEGANVAPFPGGIVVTQDGERIALHGLDGAEGRFEVNLAEVHDCDSEDCDEEHEGAIALRFPGMDLDLDLDFDLEDLEFELGDLEEIEHLFEDGEVVAGLEDGAVVVHRFRGAGIHGAPKAHGSGKAIYVDPRSGAGIHAAPKAQGSGKSAHVAPHGANLFGGASAKAEDVHLSFGGSVAPPHAAHGSADANEEWVDLLQSMHEEIRALREVVGDLRQELNELRPARRGAYAR